ncbi:MAG: hypothetical protein Q4C01_03290 [Clostridia bacterium]|nr:hypothetical protein [Clostridia bacterium]
MVQGAETAGAVADTETEGRTETVTEATAEQTPTPTTTEYDPNREQYVIARNNQGAAKAGQALTQGQKERTLLPVVAQSKTKVSVHSFRLALMRV